MVSVVRTRIVGAVVLGALVVVACGSDPVTDEPEMVGAATVRDLKEIPVADLDAPEVSGARRVRFRYEVEGCGADDLPGLPEAVRVTYTIDSVAVVVTPAAVDLDCASSERVRATRGLEVFLDEPVDDRTVTARLDP